MKTLFWKNIAVKFAVLLFFCTTTLLLADPVEVLSQTNRAWIIVEATVTKTKANHDLQPIKIRDPFHPECAWFGLLDRGLICSELLKHIEFVRDMDEKRRVIQAGLYIMRAVKSEILHNLNSFLQEDIDAKGFTLRNPELTTDEFIRTIEKIEFIELEYITQCGQKAIIRLSLPVTMDYIMRLDLPEVVRCRVFDIAILTLALKSIAPTIANTDISISATPVVGYAPGGYPATFQTE